MFKSVVWVAVVLICIACLGVAYAAWSDTLAINSQVQTGSFEVVFSAVSSTDPPGTIDPLRGKDVAECVTTIVNGGKGILVKISRAYTWYFVSVTFTIANTGTIPARLGAPVMDSLPEGIWFTVSSGIEGTVLNPNQSCQGSLVIFVGSGLARNTLYPFTISLPAVQWNYGS